MMGTKEGGKAAAATNKKKYGKDFYAKIGAAGGKNGHTGGFFANRDLARVAGARGGSISRRGPKVKVDPKLAERKTTIFSLLHRFFS